MTHGNLRPPTRTLRPADPGHKAIRPIRATVLTATIESTVTTPEQGVADEFAC